MTFHGPAQYAHQQLSRAIDTLATSPGDIRSRLLLAHESFHTLTPEHFPEQLRKDFEWIMNQLTKRGPYINYKGEVQKGSVQFSLEHMRNSTGTKIAEKLIELHYAIENYVNPK